MTKFLVAIFLTGCATVNANAPEEPPFSGPRPLCLTPELVAIDMDADPEYDNAVSTAVKFWNDAIGYIILIDVGRTYLVEGEFQAFTSIRTASVDKIEEWNSTIGGETTTYYGKIVGSDWCIRGNEISIGPESSEYGLLDVVITHELGHAIGLSHSGEQYTLMYYMAFAETRIALGSDTMAELKTLGYKELQETEK